MRTNRPDILRFLKILPTMGVFWISLVLVGVSLFIGDRIFTNAFQTSAETKWFGLVCVGILTMAPVILCCYHLYAGKLPLPAEKQELLIISKIEILAAVPLILGGGAGVYLIVAGWLGTATMVLFAAYFLWLNLRRKLCRRP